jgi:hypothetical protein
MTRRDTYMDALLRHLGAVSYEALHAGPVADVARARAAIGESLTEQPPTVGPVGHGKPHRRNETSHTHARAGR